MAGWKGSTRRARLPAGWAKTQARILARDGYQCQHIRQDTGRPCMAASRQVDHIRPGDDHRDENLAAICDYHHGRKSGSEGGIASGIARRARRKADTPRHPGLLP